MRLEHQALQADQQGLQRHMPSRQECQGQVAEELAALRHDYQSLADATQVITRERDALRERVAELEAVQRRLVDMVWGRRSERRTESPDQRHLNFLDEPIEPPSTEEQEVISAQAKADEAFDQELLRRLAARRKARQQQQRGREEFPPHMERRVRVIDLPEEEKAGLKLLRIKISERMRFEKPVVYIEQIPRYEYVVPGQPEQGVKSAPAPLSIVEGCKYDFSVIAAMIGMKYAFHLPTYRQQDWFAQCGWFPSRSTANDLINYGVDTIDPL